MQRRLQTGECGFVLGLVSALLQRLHEPMRLGRCLAARAQPQHRGEGVGLVHGVRDLSFARVFGVEVFGVDESARFVPAVARGAAQVRATVLALAELPGAVPVVALASAVEAFFSHETVHDVPAKAAARCVLVDQFGEPSGDVVDEAEREPGVLAAREPPPQVVAKRDGVAVRGRLDLREQALFVVGVALDLAVGEVRGADAPLRVALVAGASTERVDDFDEFAKAVVAVAGGLTRAVGVAGELPGGGVAQLLDAASGVVNAQGLIAGERGVGRFGVFIALDFALLAAAALAAAQSPLGVVGVAPAWAHSPPERGYLCDV